jgi:hypothetical protein
MDNEVIAFLKSLLNPEEYGWAVTQEIRDEARRLLGIYNNNEHTIEDK